jgi:predicted nucleic acid-binding protein
MTKAFIDTSVIIRLLIKDDPLKTRACEIYRSPRGGHGIFSLILRLTLC